MPTTRKPPAHQLRVLSVASETDPRTVARYLAGERVAFLPRQRIQRALRALGWTELEPETQGER